MEAVIQSVVAGLPVMVVHFVVTVAVFAAASSLYLLVTPHRELELVKQGNIAAAITLAAGLVGLAIPLAVCMAYSVSVADIVIWAAVVVILQLGAYRIVEFLLKDLAKRIENNEVAAATVFAAVKLSLGLITAAAISA
jgi:putative membrane protein